MFIFPTPILNSNLKFLFSKQVTKPFNPIKHLKIASFSKSLFQKSPTPPILFNTKISKPHTFYQWFPRFFFFHYFSTLLKRLCIITKLKNTFQCIVGYFPQIHYLFCLLIWEDENCIKLTGWFEADKHLFLRPSKTSWRIWWSAGMGPFCTGCGGSGVWGWGGCGVACWRGCGVIGWYPWKTKTNFLSNCHFL